eukprot:7096639-Prymnesium_polylepis.1
MASFCRSAAPPRREWTVEDAARFAALKEFKLLQLLSTDRPIDPDKHALLACLTCGVSTRPLPRTDAAASANEASCRCC